MITTIRGESNDVEENDNVSCVGLTVDILRQNSIEKKPLDSDINRQCELLKVLVFSKILTFDHTPVTSLSTSCNACNRASGVLCRYVTLLVILCAFSMRAGADLPTLAATLEGSQTLLTAEELDVILQAVSDLDSEKIPTALLAQWCEPLDIDGQTYYALKYKNPEIRELVVRTYILASLREEERSSENKNMIENSSEDSEDEGSQGDFDLLSDVAESTLSEELYEYIWDFPQRSSFRDLYVAYVYPDRTVQRLTSATLGRTKDGEYFAGDYLFFNGVDNGLEIADAFKHIADIVVINDELATARRNEIVTFIDTYAFHYAQQSDENSSPWRDFRVRESALKILSHIGEMGDVSLVQKLVVDAPMPNALMDAPIDIVAYSKLVLSKIQSRAPVESSVPSSAQVATTTADANSEIIADSSPSLESSGIEDSGARGNSRMASPRSETQLLGARFSTIPRISLGALVVIVMCLGLVLYRRFGG